MTKLEELQRLLLRQKNDNASLRLCTVLPVDPKRPLLNLPRTTRFNQRCGINFQSLYERGVYFDLIAL